MCDNDDMIDVMDREGDSKVMDLLNNDNDYDSFTCLVKRKMENYCRDKDSNQTDFERTKKLLYRSKIKIKREEQELINKISRNKSKIYDYIKQYLNITKLYMCQNWNIFIKKY